MGRRSGIATGVLTFGVTSVNSGGMSVREEEMAEKAKAIVDRVLADRLKDYDRTVAWVNVQLKIVANQAVNDRLNELAAIPWQSLGKKPGEITELGRDDWRR